MANKKKDSALMVLEGHENAIYSVAITPDGKLAVSGSYDGTLKVWDLLSGKCTATFKGHKWDVRSVAVTFDGKGKVRVQSRWSLTENRSPPTACGA